MLEVVREFASSAGFADDEVIDASTTSGAIRNNKTGDVLVRVDGDPDCVIGIEVKLDKGVRLGELADRDPTAKTDTAANDATNDQADLLTGQKPYIGIITAYNDMLSAHQPYENFHPILDGYSSH